MSNAEESISEIELVDDTAQQRAQLVIGGLLIALLALLVYSRVFSAAYVGPDAVHILDNTDYERIESALHADETFGAGPLGAVLIATQRSLFGDSLRAYHAVSILGHILSALIVFSLIRRLLHDRSGEIAPLLCGFTFALHPLATSAVNALRFQPVVLATVCVLLVSEATARVVFGSDRYRVVPSAIAVFAVAVGIGIHPIGYCAAPLALLYDAAVRRSRGMSLTLLPHGPVWLVTIASYLVARNVGNPDTSTSFMDALKAVSFYIGEVLVPSGLSVFHPALTNPSTFSAIFFGIVLVLSVVLVLYRGGAITFAIAWLVGAAFLTVYAIGAPFHVEEALGYLTIAGASIAVGAIAGLVAKLPPGSAVAGLLGFILIATAGVQTFRRNGDYTDPMFLWGEPVTRHKSDAEPLFYLGTIHVTQGENLIRTANIPEATDEERGTILGEAQEQFESARGFLEEATRLDPNNPLHHYYLGLVSFYSNDYASAVRSLRRTLVLDPESQRAAIRLGLIKQAQGDAADDYKLRRDAIDYYHVAASLGPLPDDIRHRYAAALSANGELREALAILEGESTSTVTQQAVYQSGILAQEAEALRAQVRAQQEAEANALKQMAANPQDANARAVAAQPLIEQHRYLDAAFYLEEILETNPQSSAAWLILGVARGAMDQVDIFLRDWPNPPPMPDDETPWRRIARACIGSGHGPAGEKYLATDPAGEEFPLSVAGRIAFEVKRFDYARDVFTRAAEAYPDQYEPWIGLAAIARQAGDIATADEAEAKAKSLGAPTNALDNFTKPPA